MEKIVRIHEKDNVAVALCSIEKGEMLRVGENEFITLEEIPQGHKVAITDISNSSDVIKYGFPIGHTTNEIPQGSWVHVQNLKTNLEGEITYKYQPDWSEMESIEAEQFLGYKRPDGKTGIRNEIWILPTVGCVNGVIKALAEENQNLVTGSIDGLYAFGHPFGCSQTGEDHATTRKLLAALAKHPNAGAVLVVGLGCENLSHQQFVEELGVYEKERIQFLICQDVENEMETGRLLLEKCAEYASRFKREPVPVSELVIGMKCGGSDGLSGITANPTVGVLNNMICAQGGTTILTEVPEMFGAEEMIMNRCASQDIFNQTVDMINRFKHYFTNHNEVVYDNPSPGNKQGGITTLEDKSCGCVQKGGKAPVCGILDYGDSAKEKGLNLLYGPGNDLVSATALTAAGSHMILFTTGRGTPFGAPAPTIKIATNSALYNRKKGWIDFNAGTVAEGEEIHITARRLLDYVVRVASGEKTCSEEKNFREISIFKDGVVL